MCHTIMTPIKNFFCIITLRHRYVNIDIDPQIKTELEAIAREKGMTLNDLIVQALTEAVEQGEEIIALNSFHNVEEEPVKSTPTKKQPVKKSPSKKQTRKAK